jgi:site-specific recombinase XerD/SAM-dependent methyltransferase
MLPLLNEFKEQLLRDGKQINTIQGRLRACVFFWKWWGSDDVQKVTRKDIDRYKVFLMVEYSPKIGRNVGEKLTKETINMRLSAIAGYFKFLHSKKKIFFDPTINLKFVETETKFPTYIPTEADIQELINKPDPYTYVGMRDRLLLEFSYTCPLRNIELRRLLVSDIDMKEKFVYPSRAKGGYECGIPIAASTYQVLDKYLAIARPRLLKNAKRPVPELFVTKYGTAFSQSVINEIFEKYRGDKHIHPHAMRHACAVHMLRNGARIRDVQLMLGHRSLTSTQTYTMLTADDLKNLHTQYHPREKKHTPANKKPANQPPPAVPPPRLSVRPVLHDRRYQWESIYKTQRADAVGWHTPRLEKSLSVISRLPLLKDARILDVGTGVSTLLGDLLSEGYTDISALDISSEAIKLSQNQLGDRAKRIKWIEADIANVRFRGAGIFDIWHDRGVYHFLKTEVDKSGYKCRLGRALKKGGFAIIAAFGPNGPVKCTGLDVIRYSPESLMNELGRTNFALRRYSTEFHTTPSGLTQEYIYFLIQRVR